MNSRRQLAKYVTQAWIEKTVPRQQLINQMAAYLLESGRTNEVDLLVNDIKLQIEKEYGVTVADVSSAHPLTEDLRHQIRQLVTEKTKAPSVRLSEEIDEQLIGGAIIDTPTMSIDLSVRGKLNKLRSRS